MALIGSRDDVTDLLSAADLALLPSRREARSVLAQEALHARVPLVASDAGGIPELVGDAAELVPAGDARALADAVVRLSPTPRGASGCGRRACGRQPPGRPRTRPSPRCSVSTTS